MISKIKHGDFVFNPETQKIYLVYCQFLDEYKKYCICFDGKNYFKVKISKVKKDCIKLCNVKIGSLSIAPKPTCFLTYEMWLNIPIRKHDEEI